MSAKSHMIFDPIYGFIRLTDVEWEIIHSLFYQRLRWIKQLGFSCYVFPGAEHSRFGHSIGVMFNAHKILKSCRKAVSDKRLFEISDLKDPATLFHQSIRLAALMHDLGTFPFSHTLEGAYIRHGQKVSKNGKEAKGNCDHEELGSFIIKNTDYQGGITFILKKYGIDSQNISQLVQGIDSSVLANQILHSEIDCDRMDYLLRDAHYTGLKYGTYDRDYLLYHFKVANVADQEILTIKQNALHSVEDFLMARFAWYSQVIRSARGAKFDAMAEELCSYLLQKNQIYSFGNLLEFIEKSPLEFYNFTDSYFMSLIKEFYQKGEFDKNLKIKELAEGLIFEKGPKTIRCEEFEQKLLNQDDPNMIEKVMRRAVHKVEEIEHILLKKGNERHWIVADIPQKYIMFIKSHRRIIKGKVNQNILLERDPVKIIYENGEVKLLAEVENSVISRLQNSFYFSPNVFCSEAAFDLLVNEGIIKK